MAEKMFYIVTVGGGKCLDNTKTGKGILDCLPVQSNSQRWVIEPSDETNVVAFKSCEGGQYLTNKEPHKVCWGKIGMGERQFWTLEQGRTPGSCFVRSNSCTTGESYLNDFQGRYRNNNTVHMWQMEKHLAWWLDWYFVDASNTSFDPVIGNAASHKDRADLEARERELAQKENQMIDLEQKAEELAEREAALSEKEENIASKEGELREQASRQADSTDKGTDRTSVEPEDRAPALDEKGELRERASQQGGSTDKGTHQTSDGTDERTTALDEREASLGDRERDVAAKEQTLAGVERKGKAVEEKEAGLAKRERELDAKEAASSKRAEVDKTQPTPSQRPERAAGSSVSKHKLALL